MSDTPTHSTTLRSEPRPETMDLLLKTRRSHQLRTPYRHFQTLWNGESLFEACPRGHDIRVGDIVKMKEYDVKKGTYSGRVIHGEVTGIRNTRGGAFLDLKLLCASENGVTRLDSPPWEKPQAHLALPNVV